MKPLIVLLLPGVAALVAVLVLLPEARYPWIAILALMAVGVWNLRRRPS